MDKNWPKNTLCSGLRREQTAVGADNDRVAFQPQSFQQFPNNSPRGNIIIASVPRILTRTMNGKSQIVTG
jgi:hypothetical protein